MSEMSGIVAAGELAHIPKWASVLVTFVFLVAVVVTGSYRTVQGVALAIGAFELLFIVSMCASPVDWSEFANGLVEFPSSSKCYSSTSHCWTDYIQIWTANIGAVIMPWMIFFQQSASIDNNLTPADLPVSRCETAVGAVLTQLIMISVVVTTAATLWAGQLNDDRSSLEEIKDVTDALIESSLGDVLDDTGCKVVLGLGILGSSLISSIVVSLTAAWGLGEVTGYKHSLEESPAEAPWFYAIYVVLVAIGAAFSLSSVPNVKLNLAIQLMNAALLPVVLGFLFALAIVALPENHKSPANC